MHQAAYEIQMQLGVEIVSIHEKEEELKVTLLSFAST